MEVWDGRGSNAARRDAKGCVLGALERRHVSGGQVTAPGRAGILQHRPDELPVQRSLGLFLVAECGGGQGLHHIQPRPCPSDDFLAVRPEGHTSVHGHTQDFGRWADRDDSASQSDYGLLLKLPRVWGEEGDGRFAGRHLHAVPGEPVLQLVNVALEVLRSYIHLVIL